MNPRLLALLLAGVAAVLTLHVDPSQVGTRLQSLLASVWLPSHPEIVAVIETKNPPTPLDAALILRATLRFDPKGVVFFDPLAGDDGRPLLASKVAEAEVPVQFASHSRAITAPRPLPTEEWAPGISFDRLLVRTERSERGEISPDLDTLFRHRWIAVQTPGGSGAAEMAAKQNGFRTADPLTAAAAFPIALAASLPWWINGRRHRFFVALVISGGWLLLALALAREHLAIPLAAMLALPLLALIPPPSHKFQERKLPA